MVNWSEWQNSLVEKSFGPYEAILGVFAWVLIFSGIIGYVYLKQRSYTAAAVAALVIVTVFTNYWYGVETWLTIIYIFTALAFTALLLIFISKRRN